MSRTLIGSIDLTKMKTALKMMKNKAGEQVECLVIPIKDNNLIKGQKGIYMDIKAIIHDSNDQYGNIAMLTKNVSIKSMFGEGKTYQSLSEEEKAKHKAATPIIGNMKEIGSETPIQSTPMQSGGDDEDLPF